MENKDFNFNNSEDQVKFNQLPQEEKETENISGNQFEVETDFTDFVPNEFQENPFEYFQRYGVNIKAGEIKRDLEGKVKEDPTATKDLPIWKNEKGQELHVVGKRVNTEKSQIAKSKDPFYEYSIMEIAHEFGLPAPRPVAKVTKENQHLIIMEKVKGIRWTEESMKTIHESNLTDADKQNMLNQAEQLMVELRKRYEEVGLYRTWKIKDMIADVDISNKTVLALIPTDWERTKIDQQKLIDARQKKSAS